MIKNKFVTIRLPQALYEKLKAEAARNTRTVSAQLMHYVRLQLDKP
jgi:predicted DNA-binding protein